MVTLVLLRVIVVVLLVAINAFFVAAEFALVSVRDTRIEQLVAAQRTGAKTVQKLQRNIGEVLAAVQFGVTVCSLGLGWLGEATIAQIIQVGLARLPHVKIYAHAVAMTVAFLLITYLLVTLGELVPKSVALHRSDRVAMAIAGPLDVVITVVRPLLRAMSSSAGFVSERFGSPRVREAGVHTPDELGMIVTASRRVGLLPEIQENMIHRALELASITVREVMTLRPDIFSLPADMSIEDALDRVVDSQHSRIPIYDPKLGPEHILGVLYAKDLMRLLHLRLKHPSMPAVRPGSTRLRHIMRDVLVVPETKELSDLLVEFKERRRHLAVVVDEFGSTAGVITVEDVLEQIVGELEDEFDAAKAPDLDFGPSGEVLEGSENIRDLEIQHQIKLPRDAGFETLGGFILAQLQRVPTVGESFEFGGRRFTVAQMDGHRVAAVRVERVQNPVPSSS
ncbi:MAG: HlyC/CorC family transporter [Acidobacteria bacterium]|nr:HlyC/CorC family transporter [Acidobacteriota bacterium]